MANQNILPPPVYEGWSDMMCNAGIGWPYQGKSALTVFLQWKMRQTRGPCQHFFPDRLTLALRHFDNVSRYNS